MFQIAQFSSAGPHIKNEDAFGLVSLTDGRVIGCVADGVGGESKGEIASSFVVNQFLDRLAANDNLDLIQTISDINNKLIQYVSSIGIPPRVFTTFTGIQITPEGRLCGIHIGDSRGLILRRNGIQQLTDDHTEALRFLREGKLTKEEFKDYPRKNVLESAMGMDPIPITQELNFQLLKNDRILLMSDGVYGKISKREIRDLSVSSLSIEQLIASITDWVESSNPDDNWTIVGIEFI